MDSMKVTAEQAMDALRIPAEEQKFCFLQVLFGHCCKIFLDIVACPNWTKLQRLGCPCMEQANTAIADTI
jgi:hypothetical protein